MKEIRPFRILEKQTINDQPQRRRDKIIQEYKKRINFRKQIRAINTEHSESVNTELSGQKRETNGLIQMDFKNFVILEKGRFLAEEKL